MQAALRYVAYVVTGGMIVFSLFADEIGIGRSPGFGYQQVGGVLLGIAALAAMVWVSRRNQ